MRYTDSFEYVFNKSMFMKAKFNYQCVEVFIFGQVCINTEHVKHSLIFAENG